MERIGGIVLYSIGKPYKFEMPDKIFYTGLVLEEDKHAIKIQSKFNEELILNKEEIIQAKRIGEDRNEGAKEY